MNFILKVYPLLHFILNVLFYVAHITQSVTIFSHMLTIDNQLWLCFYSFYFFQGMDSGYAGGEDELYNVYDQPFRGGRDMAQNLYRPSKNADKDMYGDDLDTLMQNNRYEETYQAFIFRKKTAK